jgi:hypothetical protein
MEKILKYDLHVHAMLSKTIPFKMHDLNLMIAQAQKRCLNGFALTEHIHAPTYWDTYRLLRKEYNYSCGIFKINANFNIFNGAEVNLREDGHVLVIGEMELIRELDSRLDLNNGYRPSLEELVDTCSDDLLLIGAHPFRPNGGVIKCEDALLKRLNALELNGKDYKLEGRVREEADRLDMPVVGGSDAHLWPQVGISMTMFPSAEISINMLRETIDSGEIEAFAEKNSSFVIAMCNQHKRRIKMVESTRNHKQKVKSMLTIGSLTQNSAIQLSYV